MTMIPAGMENARQFITYNLVPNLKFPGKFDKKPCDARGLDMDAHARGNWLTADAAMAQAAALGGSAGVGFVFSELDRFFFIDLDNALDPATGQWSQLAQDVCAVFAGAAMEVSQSGRGLHIFGSADVPPHRKRAPGLEFYSEGRFAALTGKGRMGSAAIDFTAVIPAFMAQYGLDAAPEAAETVIRTSGVHPHCEPIEDDAELITRMCESVGSARAAFEAHPRDLWHGNATALGKRYPTGNGVDLWDRSAADLGLINTLYYWTGDVARTERLFLRSAIARPEHYGRRPDLMTRMLHMAARDARSFFQKSWRPPTPPAQLPAAGGAAARAAASWGLEQTGYEAQAPTILQSELEGNVLPESEPELIKRLLPASPGLVCFIAGQSGAGKTFYCVSLAIALASGQPLLGLACRERVGVIYVAAEGGGTIQERIYAAKHAACITGQLPIQIVRTCPNLMTETGRAALIAEINRCATDMIRRGLCERVGAVIIDTLTVAFPMDDEQGNTEATRVCGHMRGIGIATGTVIVPVHHFGKNQEAGLRGASAWRAAADHCVAVLGDRSEQTGDVTDRKLAVTKSRTDIEGVICCFELKITGLGFNRYGEPRSTCVFTRTDEDPKMKSTGKGISYFNQAYDAALKNHPQRSELKSPDGSRVLVGVPLITMSIEFEKYYPGERDASRKAWTRTLKKMCDEGADYYQYDAYVYLGRPNW